MLFRKKMDRHCVYCKFAGRANDNQMICEKKGIVSENDQCRRFQYDPLKRIPARPMPKRSKEFTDEDFSL